MVLRHGKLLHSGRDFAAERDAHLHDLTAFIPPPRAASPFEPLHVHLPLPRNSFFRNIIVQAAFFKNSVLHHGGHLHVPFLNISYIRIPKSANTSISWAVLQSIYPALQQKQLSATAVNFLTDANLRPEITHDDSNDIFFTVVRNPMARVVSVYRDFFERAEQPFLYSDYLFGIFDKNISFAEFVVRLQAIPAWLMDPHVKPQHYFLESYKRKGNNVVVLKLDNGGEVDSFLSIYGMKMASLNRSPEPYDYHTYYDATTLQQVYSIYRKDIRIFGYEKEYEALKEKLKA